MIAPRALPWLWATLLAMALSTSYLLDGPSDHQAAIDQSENLQDAIKSEAMQARYKRAARQFCCSEHATAQDLGNGTVQCNAKRGHKASKVVL